MATKSVGFDSLFSTTLNGAIDGTTLSITLADAPTATEGFLVIEPANASKREVIYYTSKSGAVLTIAADGRGYDGTTATTHESGVSVISTPVAAMFEALQDGTGLHDDIIDSRHYTDGSIDAEHFANGAVTSPKRGTPVAFSAYSSGDQSISASTITKVAFDTQRYDYGSDYDNTTYEFTAPYDGIYYFSLHLYYQSITDQKNVQARVISDVGILELRTYTYSPTTTQGVSVSGCAKLSAGDKVWAEGYCTDASPQIHAGSLSQFHGYLVGRT